MKGAPWHAFRPSKSPAPVRFIDAKGLEIRCNRLGIFKSDGKKMGERWGEIEGMGLTVPDVAYDMQQTLAMDLETCSIAHSNGHFLVYAIGYRYMGRKFQLIAESIADLRGGLMWRAMEKWQQIAEEINENAEESRCMYTPTTGVSLTVSRPSTVSSRMILRCLQTNWKAMVNSSASSGEGSSSGTAV